jgi:toxin YoeB
LGRPTDPSAIFKREFLDDFRYWVKADRSVALRVLDLVESVLRDPLHGVGKPEPLKYSLAGCWSRRITQEHRLVYKVTGESVEFLQARFHY